MSGPEALVVGGSLRPGRDRGPTGRLGEPGHRCGWPDGKTRRAAAIIVWLAFTLPLSAAPPGSSMTRRARLASAEGSPASDTSNDGRGVHRSTSASGQPTHRRLLLAGGSYSACWAAATADLNDRPDNKCRRRPPADRENRTGHRFARRAPARRLKPRPIRQQAHHHADGAPADRTPACRRIAPGRRAALAGLHTDATAPANGSPTQQSGSGSWFVKRDCRHLPFADRLLPLARSRRDPAHRLRPAFMSAHIGTPVRLRDRLLSARDRAETARECRELRVSIDVRARPESAAWHSGRRSEVARPQKATVGACLSFSV